MEGLTRALAVELAPIRVNIVSPGVVRTPLWANMTEADRQVFYRETAARLLVGHVGDAEEIAEAYLYLMRQGLQHRSSAGRGWRCRTGLNFVLCPLHSVHAAPCRRSARRQSRTNTRLIAHSDPDGRSCNSKSH
jgi:hypothetical protein